MFWKLMDEDSSLDVHTHAFMDFALFQMLSWSMLTANKESQPTQR